MSEYKLSKFFFFNILIINNFNVPDLGFWWILDMLFYRKLTINGEKICLVVFFVAFGPFLSYFYPPILKWIDVSAHG